MQNNSESKKLYSFDTSKDKKLMFYVNLTEAVVGAVLLLIGCKIVPFKEMYNVSGLTKFMWRSVALVLCMAACLALHEMIHIIAVKHFTGESAEKGFDKFYPYVGSKEELNKKNYLRISLAPIVIIDVFLLILLAIAPRSWFWLVYITLTMHVSGTVGDIYCAYKIISEKNGITIIDNGKAVEIWLK